MKSTALMTILKSNNRKLKKFKFNMGYRELTQIKWVCITWRWWRIIRNWQKTRKIKINILMKIAKWFNTNNLTKLKIKKMIRALKTFQKIIELI